ncbi:MAG: phosphate acyltransferase PlsX [Acidimicrobiia bacterium]
MPEPLTVAIDAMGGDHAPTAIVEGALQSVDQLGVRVLLVGDEAAIRGSLPAGELPDGVAIQATSEVIEMHDEPGAAVRKKKDSSVVRAAEAVRDGRADAMVGAGNTGATMAAALLRFGRIRGASRPAIGVPIPVPFGQPQLLVDGGATVDCSPEWLVQFAQMGRAYAQLRLGEAEPTVGLLSNGEEPGKGDDLRKRTFALLEGRPWFVGNVEGRELMSGHPHVIVTDGFTGNVALKTVEGALKAAAHLVFTTLAAPEAKAAADVVAPLLLQGVTDYLDPDTIGGAALLGVAGVCVISHGSSSPRAIVNAVALATECVTGGLVDRMQDAIVEPTDGDGESATGTDRGGAVEEEEAYAR